MTTNLEKIIDHVETQQNRLYDPLRTDVDNLKVDVNGNGKEGLKTKVKVMETVMDAMKQDMDEIKTNIKELNAKIDSLMWKVAVITGSMSILVQVVFQLIPDK